MTGLWRRIAGARRDNARVRSALRFIEDADPCDQWREVNAKVDEILPLLPPPDGDLPETRASWAALVREYEHRKAAGLYDDDPRYYDDLVYGRRPLVAPPSALGDD
jgi:hypothetical protein